MEYNPDAPAFGENAEKVEEPKAETPVEAVAETEKKETEEPLDEDSKVPYTRFKKFHDRARELEAKEQEYQAEIERLKQSEPAPAPVSSDNAPFSLEEWTELYGDSELTRKAYQKQKNMFDKLFEQSEVRAIEAVEQRTRAEKERVAKNLSFIDSGLEALNEYAGKPLSEAEQNAVLDIVDEFSPKDENENYTSTIPFEKAYEIMALRAESKKAPKIQKKNEIASIINSKGKGQADPEQAQRDKDFMPGWSRWRNRLPKDQE